MVPDDSPSTPSEDRRSLASGRARWVALGELARPHHWIKNLIVLAPVLTAGLVGSAEAWASALAAAGAMCLLASGIYALNDLRDRRADRLHPDKRHRPLASGRLRPAEGALAGVAWLVGGLGVASLVGWGVLALCAAYVALQLAYTAWLKRAVILDVLCIALGFVLRAAAGGVAIGVEISPWLIVCTLTLMLFMGFCKRYNEVAALDADDRTRHRSTLADYTTGLLMHLITLSASIAVIAYLMYATSEMTVERIDTYYLVYLLPLVIYGVCRFAMLSMTARYSGPVDILLHDRPLQVVTVLAVVADWLVVTHGQDIQAWIERAMLHAK